jgi:hypothetical protein
MRTKHPIGIIIAPVYCIIAGFGEVVVEFGGNYRYHLYRAKMGIV